MLTSDDTQALVYALLMQRLQHPWHANADATYTLDCTCPRCKSLDTLRDVVVLFGGGQVGQGEAVLMS